MDLEPGLVIANRYRLDARIGAGGMGEVWAATQSVTRKAVALKFLLSGTGTKATQEESRRRFLREARAACAVRHPNVVQIHDVLELEDGSPVMVMELLEGESLESRLERDGALAVGDAAALLSRVVSAVGAAHAVGIVHRDLKPDNIFLTKTATGLDVKVLDFGIAKLTGIEGDAAATGGLTATGAMLGTPYYMSPEQAFGEKRIDHRADIWALGIILYRCVTGVLPTAADNIGQILKIIMTNGIPPMVEVAPRTPPELLELVGRMLQVDPSKRPKDLTEVSPVLERLSGVQIEAFGPPSASPTSSTFDGNAVPGAERAAPVRRSKKSFVPLVVGGAALALIGTVGVLANQRRAAPAQPTDDVAAPSARTSASATTPVASAEPDSSDGGTHLGTVLLPLEASAVSTKDAGVRQVAVSPVRSTLPKTPNAVASGVVPATASSTDATKKAAIGGVIEKPPF